MTKVFSGMVAIGKSRPFVALAFGVVGFVLCMVVHGIVAV